MKYWHAQLSRAKLNVVLVILLSLSFAALMMSVALSWHAYQPLPYPQSDKLMWLRSDMVDDEQKVVMAQAMSTPVAWQLAQDKQVFEQASAVFYSQGLLRGALVEPKVSTTYVHQEFFSLFDMSLKRGRWFSQSDTLGETLNEAVVSECFAQQHLSGDALIGQTLQLDERYFTIVGVAACDDQEPQLFQSNQGSDVFLPFALAIGEGISDLDHLAVRSDVFLVGRVPKSKDVELHLAVQQANLQSAFKQAQIQQGLPGRVELVFALQPLVNKLKGQLKTTMHWLTFASVALLLITLVNTFSLYLLDFKSKQTQLALAITMGAKRADLKRAQWCYIAFIFLLSSAIAAVIAQGGLGLFRVWTQASLAHVTWLSVPWWSILSVIAFSQLCAWVFVLLALSQVSFRDIRSQLSGSGKGQTKQLPNWVGQSLLGTQMGIGAITMGLAFWLLSYFGGQLLTHSGFNAESLYFVELQQSDYARSDDAIQARYNQAKINLAALNNHPDIDSAALAAVIPHEFVFLEPLSRGDDGTNMITAYLQLIGENYFVTTGQRFIAGGGFNQDDLSTTDTGQKVIINQKLAQMLELNSNDVGTTLYDRHQRPIKLVGIVENTFSHSLQVQPLAYLPFNFINGNIIVRAKANASLELNTITELYKAHNPSQSILRLVDIKARMQQLNKSAMLSFWAGLAIAVVMLFQVVAGMYGLIGYLAILSAPVFSIKCLVGAKVRDILVEQCKVRAYLIIPVMICAYILSLAIGRAFGILTAQLWIYMIVACVFTSCIIFILELYHVSQQANPKEPQ
ncbi:ABC transporter permease [Pseudoalteromonas sp. McH1-7]|uniref:ABC transporter permease n=1 Tax=Pseudoalteromonas sp. McH1-7 TaxID=2745574 RepID=UPI0015910AC8|nr:ABC transporter permease [Pseudoalteromonas sp. McH1-7]NUZ12332.1 ABC transporter permease [Pseudoalteromonas sp. McH1-7]